MSRVPLQLSWMHTGCASVRPKPQTVCLGQEAYFESSQGSDARRVVFRVLVLLSERCPAVVNHKGSLPCLLYASLLMCRHPQRLLVSVRDKGKRFSYLYTGKTGSS